MVAGMWAAYPSHPGATARRRVYRRPYRPHTGAIGEGQGTLQNGPGNTA